VQLQQPIGQFVHLEIVAEGLRYPTMYNNCLQQTGYFLSKMWSLPPRYYLQHCAQCKMMVSKLLRGQQVALMGWNLAWRSGPLYTKFHPHRCTDGSMGPPKLKILLKFYQILEYKWLTWVYPLRNFYEICSICSAFQNAIAVKIWMDLLKGLRSYGGFQLRGRVSPKFLAPP